jgi:NADH-quinone oxidoreductase subunit A
LAVEQYNIVAVFFFVGLAFLVLLLLLSWFLSPRRPNPEKLSTYECGNEPVGQSWGQFNIRYYIFALLFVLFDIEAVFIFPWAMQSGKMNLVIFIDMLIFLIILTVGLVYAWRKGTLKWEE